MIYNYIFTSLKCFNNQKNFNTLRIWIVTKRKLRQKKTEHPENNDYANEESKNEDDIDKNLITLDVTLDMGSGASKYEVKISLENENDRHENVRLVYKTFRPELCMFFFR